MDSKYTVFLFTCLLHQHGLISISNVINSLAYAFYIINFSSFVIFANKINSKNSITSECVEQQKLIRLQQPICMRLTHVPDTLPQL